MSKTAAALIGIAGAAVIMGAFVTFGILSEEEPPEGYRIAYQDTVGNQRNIIVEVHTDDDLRRVFDDLLGRLDDDAGYYVAINCVSGGTDTQDNRLANGRYAVGTIGQAVTALPDGGIEFERVERNTCPAVG